MKTYCDECKDSGTGLDVVQLGNQWLCKDCYDKVAIKHYLTTGKKLCDFELKQEQDSYDGGMDHE